MVNEELSKNDLRQIEHYADSLFKVYGIDVNISNRHFFDRVNDTRNGKPIDIDELKKLFKSVFHKHGRTIDGMDPGAQAVIKSMSDNINMPFVISWNDKDREFELIAKTIMRKHNFQTSNTVLKVENILAEGGSYGHMFHIFDIDTGLNFGDLRDIANKSLNGELEMTREKTDGTAIAISWRNGNLIAARNKGHLKNSGETAMSMDELISKFEGRGELSNAFKFAIEDLYTALNSLPEKSKLSIFKNGKVFMHCEIIYPAATNVIPYGANLLVFHNTTEYDESGTAIGANVQDAYDLSSMIEQVNQHVQKTFKLQSPPNWKLPKTKELQSLKDGYLSKIQKLQSRYNLKNTDGVKEYYREWLREHLNKKFSNKISASDMELILQRLVDLDKSIKFNKLSDQELAKSLTELEKNELKYLYKEAIDPFEEIFLGIGADVLSFMVSVLTANPKTARSEMISGLKSAINRIRASADEKSIQKLEFELKRLQKIGGIKKIVPSEGIVFTFKGNTYKLTGAFAPLNQIMGIFRY